MTYSEKYRKPFMPLLDGVKFVPYNDPSMLEQAIDDTIGSVIIEPIQGETGITGTSRLPSAKDKRDLQ